MHAGQKFARASYRAFAGMQAELKAASFLLTLIFMD
jgi:hypothetical protein